MSRGVEHGEQQRPSEWAGVPISGVLGKEWLSLPGAEGEPAHLKGGRKWEVTERKGR